MNEATLGILLQMRENATQQISNVNTALKQLGTETSVVGPKMSTPMNTFGDTLAKNRMAVRELSMGMMFMGATATSMGAAMQSSNSQAIKSAGSMIMLVGGIMSAVASSVQVS